MVNFIKILLIVIFSAIPSIAIAWPTYTAGTVTAASCNGADIVSAVASASDGYIVAIPAGTCTISTQVTVTKQLKLMGADSLASRITCTISSGSCFSFTGTKSFELHDLYLAGGSRNTTKITALISTSVTASQWRIHGNTFDNPSYVLYGIMVDGYNGWGLVDGNTYSQSTSAKNNMFMNINQRILSGGGNDRGMSAWRDTFTWGEDGDAIYVENNTIDFGSNTADNQGFVVDGEGGGRYVFRHNDIVNGTITNHGLESQRSGMMIVSYKNKFSRKKYSAGGRPLNKSHTSRGGTYAIHDNWMNDIEYAAVNSHAYRTTSTWSTGNSCNGTNPCIPQDGTKICSNPTNSTILSETLYPIRYCNDTVQITSTATSTKLGDALCAQLVGTGSKCSLKFCSEGINTLCYDDSQCTGKGTCSKYAEGSTGAAYGSLWNIMDGVGMVSGSTVSGTHMPQWTARNYWCNNYGNGCTPTLTAMVIETTTGVGSETDTWADSHNVYSCSTNSTVAECISYIESDNPGLSMNYSQYQCPHPGTGLSTSCTTSTGDASYYGTAGYESGTPSSPDTEAPTVLSYSPDGSGILRSTTVNAVFSEAMDQTTLTTSNFTLYDGATPISGVVTKTSTTVTLTTSSTLSYETVYTATVTTGVTDVAGNALASAFTWTFKTIDNPDATVPTVISVSPSDGEQFVANNAEITIVFSEPLSEATVTTSSFSIANSSGSVTFTPSFVNNTGVSIIPESLLISGEVYTVTITTAITDTNGNALASEYSWSFETDEAPSSPSAPTVSQPGNYALTATWSAPSSYYPVTFYKIRMDGELIYTGSDLTHTESGLLRYTQYCFSAVAGNGNATESSESQSTCEYTSKYVDKSGSYVPLSGSYVPLD